MASVRLCHTSAPPPSHDGPWLFLAQDYLALRRWEAALAGERLRSGQALRDVAERLRQPFLDLVGELGRRHGSRAWWASPVSERNTLVSPLFLRCCYLRLALEEAARSDGELLVVCESVAVLATLAREHPGSEWAAPRPRGVPGGWRTGARRALRFLLRGLSRRLRRPPPPHPPRSGRPLALIRTWVDEASLRADGGFSDRYFPGLAEWLEERGHDVVKVPVLFGLERPWAEAWASLDRGDRCYLAAESLLGLRDHVAAVLDGIRFGRIHFRDVTLAGLDVSPLFEEERRRTLLDESSLEALLSARLPRRLAAAGWDVSVAFDPYENLNVSKQLILGFREASPRTRLVGYQHSSAPPMLLSHFATAAEAAFAPLPDIVVCNGPLFADVLVAEGLPGGRVVTGPALRYAHLWDEHPAAGRERAVLVPLPLEGSAAAELAFKVVAAFGDVQDVAVWLKPHPMFGREALLRALGVAELPPSFELVAGGMAEWLGRAGALVALASTTLFEAVAAGVPLVVVGRESALDLNPLGWHDGLAPVISDPDALRAQVLELLDLPVGERERRVAAGRELLERSFGRVDEAAMEAFLEAGRD